MKHHALLLLPLLLCSCARTHYLKSAEPFLPPPAGEIKDAEAHFIRHQVKILGANQGLVAGGPHNVAELIRYYDDSRHADASALATQALGKILRADDWGFFGPIYGILAGALIGGFTAYFATENYDFSAIDKFGLGALQGGGIGLASGLVAGWGGYAWERRQALLLQRQAAGEFNRSARTSLRLAPYPQKAGAAIQWEY